nr:uncharacterized protein LOC117686407 [Crassostrea gigas]
MYNCFVLKNRPVAIVRLIPPSTQTAITTNTSGGDDRSPSPSTEPIPSGEFVTPTFHLQDVTSTAGETKTTLGKTGTTTTGKSSAQEEADVETTGGRHHNPGREEEATTPVEEGMQSSGRIGNYTHPSSTSSTPPDVSPSFTTLILVTSITCSICLTIPFIVIRRKRHTTIHRLPSPILFMQESPLYTPPSPPLSIDMSTPLHTPSPFSSSTSSLM